jgi:hypothetical protein
LFDLNGALVQSIERHASWFYETEWRPNAKGSTEPPPPTPTSVTPKNVDAAGLLLVHIAIPNTAWSPTNRSAGMNSYLDVIDAVNGVVVASALLVDSQRDKPALPRGYFSGTRLGWLYRTDAAGLPEVHIVEYRLVSARNE